MQQQYQMQYWQYYQQQQAYRQPVPGAMPGHPTYGYATPPMQPPGMNPWARKRPQHAYLPDVAFRAAKA